MNAAELLITIARAESHRFVGRLGAEPEVRFLQSGNSVANGRIAINWPDARRDDRDKVDWFKIELWGDDAQTFADNAHRGDLVEVIGRVRSEQYTDRQGDAKVALVIKAETWRVLRQSGQPASAPPAPAATVPQPQQPAAAAPAWHSAAGAADGFGDIPF